MGVTYRGTARATSLPFNQVAAPPQSLGRSRFASNSLECVYLLPGDSLSRLDRCASVLWHCAGNLCQRVRPYTGWQTTEPKADCRNRLNFILSLSLALAD